MANSVSPNREAPLRTALEGAGAAMAAQYLLMTAAYNEEAHIKQTIQSVLAQTMLPERWVIVSDGSTDRTDEIIQKYAGEHEFIQFVKVQREPGRSFGSKVRALRRAGALLHGAPWQFIGNLDADVSVGPTYFEDLIQRFSQQPRLGLAGGFVYEQNGGEFKSRRGNREYSVAHAGQLVRRECYEAIGGYAVLEYGGEDWHAQISANMKGWETAAFPELRIFHHRHTGRADNVIRHRFRQGRMDYSFGSSALFEIFKCMLRIPDKPLMVGACARLSGYFWSLARRENRPVSPEFISFLRSDQRRRLLPKFPSKGKAAATRSAYSPK